MAFDRHPTVTASRIGNITITLFDPDPILADAQDMAQSATARIEVVLSDGSIKVVDANIAKHFPATTINQLRNFVASARTKAIAEIL
jgi:hypothetical protein